MTVHERGLRFACGDASLVGVLSLADAAPTGTGIVIAVGGPQYRAGSHRQFVLLSRRLAAAGYPVLRFDARGMGDSTGDFPGFEGLGADLAAAAHALQTEVGAVRRVVLWGLCDAASAALIHAPEMPQLAGLVLLNPWVRHADTQDRVELKHYYARRVFEAAFWKKLVAGRVDLTRALRELAAKAWRAARPFRRSPTQNLDYRERMARGALGFGGPQLYILSGRDRVCHEFLEYTRLHARLRGLWQREAVERVDLPTADHTFSNHALRRQVEDRTLEWLERLPPRP